MTDWGKLKVVELRAELKKRDLLTTGNKPVLVERLEAAEAEDSAREENQSSGQDPGAQVEVGASPDTVAPTEASPQTIEDLPGAEEQGKDEASARDADAAMPDVQTTTDDSTTDPQQAGKSVDTPELPPVAPQEALEDRQKRKRRSKSPAPSASDAARKRFRQDIERSERDEGQMLTSKEDLEWLDKHNGVDEAEVNAAHEEVKPAESGEDSTMVDVSKQEVVVEDSKAEQDVSMQDEDDRHGETTHDDSPNRSRDSRFRGLFSASGASGPERPVSRGDDIEETEPDRIISPALHPATAALYIRDFMRPLNPTLLRAHIAGLATPPNKALDPDIITEFFIDPIRTHAFIAFTNVSAASRVRSALHDRIWPEEKTRKALWVDFIPVEKVAEWTTTETSDKTSGRLTGKKWEVVYDTDEDRNVTATLQDLGTNAPSRPLVHQLSVANASPITPVDIPSQAGKGVLGAPSGPRSQLTKAIAPTTHLPLDSLFSQTTAKPLLYYLPVSSALASTRLANIASATAHDAAERVAAGSQSHRYTFEDGEKFVDRGPEIFPGIRRPPGVVLPPRGGGGRMRPGGGFGARGGGGGGYGGGGGGGGYDSYRGYSRGDYGGSGGGGDSRRRESYDRERY